MNKYGILTRVFIVLISIVLVGCIACFVLLCIYGVDPSLFPKKNELTDENTAQLSQTFDYGDGYLKKIVFICDETLTPIANSIDVINKDQIWTGMDGTLALDRGSFSASIFISDQSKGTSITTAIADFKPQYVIIHVGLDNGVNHCTEEQFKDYYSALVRSIKNSSPDTKIILQSVFPVSLSAEKNDPSISNKRIDTANTYVSEIAQELSVRYLNTASVLKDKNGRLDPRYDSGDGVTLNSEGFVAVAEYIKTHGYK